MNDDIESAIFATVATIIEECMDIRKSDIKPSSRLVDDLGLDSFGVWELLSGLQEQYDISVERAELRDIGTVGEIVTFVRAKLAGKKPI